MRDEHPALARVRAAVAATGWHTERWGELRREVFAGLDPWADLLAWCKDNTITCELAFGQSSKVADVQFRKLLPPRTTPLISTSTPTSKEA